MKRLIRLLAIAAAIACMVFALAGCGQEQSPEISSSASEPEVSDVAEKAAPSTEPYYVMVIGNDTRYGTIHGDGIQKDDPSYSDTMMLMRVDPVDYRIAICSIPRDTAAVVDGEEGKMNDVHLKHGPEGLCESVGELFGVSVDYYFDMTFAGFEEFIDGLGGVTVDVPMDMNWTDEVKGGRIYLNAGEQTLNGSEALVFARQRKQYPDLGEACRQQNARQLVSRVIQSTIANPSESAAAYAGLLEGLCDSNMPEDRLEADIQHFMDHGEVAVETGTGPYWGDIDYTGMWRSPSDPEVYSQLSAAMTDGTPLTDIVANPM